MTEPESYTVTHACLNCARPEMEMPLVSLRYRGEAAWICSQCLPQLIHHPQQLVGKLPGAESITPG
jgi:hypothetical protein